MKDKILIQAWVVYEYRKSYYIQHSHATYLNTIKDFYQKIHLVSPVIPAQKSQINSYSLIDKSLVVLHELPPSHSYIGAYKNFSSYLKVYKSLKDTSFDTIYSRFPSPFGWLQMFFFNSNRIVHYVGDPIDTVLKNDSINYYLKLIKIFFFLPEYFLFAISSLKASKVFSNGHHISNKLKKFSINAEPLISTTLMDEDFHKNLNVININNNKKIQLIYVGYLRKAKGIDVLLTALHMLDKQYPNCFSLTIVGEGEERVRLSQKSIELGVSVNFLGHIDDRNQLNQILRSHDIFCFASISEGSPRVVLEAVANGLLVITTPVGSLSYIFEDFKDVLFFDFNNSKMLAEMIVKLSKDINLQMDMRDSSFKKVQLFKIEGFIKEAFNA